MRVTRAQIVENGLRCRCPGCGQRTIFAPGRMFKVNSACPSCGARIETGDGAFLGPFVINYAITAFGLVIPIIVLYAVGRLGPTAALALALVSALLVPLLLYRLSWSLWLMVYYFFLPENIPANLEGRAPEDE
jgi:uncharacterized protein (DUF983 family)